ncbi:PPE family protein PPE26 [Mycobacterium attenuatum]|uniref:PPE family protein PPE26 n=2 Tax=Mycobacterium attenuatum TaxID=2341086 RepID=A0A498PPE4_9MYCO|nr:PPE family protein PPE26 [Mycobacterium attenuatum]
MMDFGALPPELNSGRLYTGPGSAPMVAAASAWNGLASELTSAAAGYEKVIMTLHEEYWSGPASALMTEAVAPYVAWMKATASQAEQAAAQARMAVAAYETAMSSVVPPPLIAANRVQLATLLARNVFGQNTAAIAAVEAQYGEMWAQDAAAMYVYAGSSANAAQVTMFTAPPHTTNPTAATTQAAAVAHAAATAAGTAEETLMKLVSAMPGALHGLASPISTLAGSTPAWIVWLTNFLNLLWPVYDIWYDLTGLPYFGIGIGNSLISSARAIGAIGPDAAAAAAGVAAEAGKEAVGILGNGGQVAAGLGNAGSIGKLSVPAAWPGAGAELAPTVRSASAPFVSDIVETEGAASGGDVFGGIPLSGAGSTTSGSGPRYGFRPKVMIRPTCAG